MAQPSLRPEELLSGVRCALHSHVAVLRPGTDAWHYALQPRTAGHRRRWISAGGTGDPGRYIPRGKTGIGIRAVHDRHRYGTGNRPGFGRLDHGQLQLALDLLHQYSDWYRV